MVTMMDATVAYENARPMESIYDIKQRHVGHFFDRDTMRSFRSRVYDDVWTVPGGALFLTSEQFVTYTPQYRKDARRYTVRMMQNDGHIAVRVSDENGDEFQKYGTLVAARKAAEKIAQRMRSENQEGC